MVNSTSKREKLDDNGRSDVNVFCSNETERQARRAELRRLNKHSHLTNCKCRRVPAINNARMHNERVTGFDRVHHSQNLQITLTFHTAYKYSVHEFLNFILIFNNDFLKYTELSIRIQK